VLLLLLRQIDIHSSSSSSSGGGSSCVSLATACRQAGWPPTVCDECTPACLPRPLCRPFDDWRYVYTNNLSA